MNVFSDEFVDEDKRKMLQCKGELIIVPEVPVCQSLISQASENGLGLMAF
jgi:hypothetical protein